MKQNKRMLKYPTDQIIQRWMHLVDAATGYIDIQFQSFFSAHATIDAAEQFEANAKNNSIIISKSQSDGGSCFTYNEF